MSGRKRVPSGQVETAVGVCSASSARIIAWLRKQFREKAAQNVTAKTGIAFNTTRKWFSNESRPSGEAIITLIAAYGPELLAAAYPKGLGWLDSAVRDEQIAALRAEQAELQRRMEALL